jgi:hypothetical protein
MDHIDKHLTTAAIYNKYPLAIKVALVIGKKTLNCYYDKTNHSEVFKIAMGTYFLALLLFFSYLRLVLHPHHKLQYFKNVGWQDDWIKQAEDIVQMEFNLLYGSLNTSWATSPETQLSKAKVCVFELSSYIKVSLFTIDHVI